MARFYYDVFNAIRFVWLQVFIIRHSMWWTGKGKPGEKYIFTKTIIGTSSATTYGGFFHSVWHQPNNNRKLQFLHLIYFSTICNATHNRYAKELKVCKHRIIFKIALYNISIVGFVQLVSLHLYFVLKHAWFPMFFWFLGLFYNCLHIFMCFVVLTFTSMYIQKTLFV
jgi:hypothetical protein